MAWAANLLGWREILLSLILLIVIYMLWLIWRMRYIGRQSSASASQRDEPRVRPDQEPSISKSAMAQESRPDDDDGDDDEETGAAPLIYTRPRRRNPYVSPAATPETEAAARQELAREAIMAGVEREVGQLRDELDALRGAFAALRSDLQALHDAFDQEMQNLRTVQNASPLYSDAMQMAVLGHDAISIAERCGISRAEAELVVALVKNKDKS
jgi:hypothetical protein